MSDELHEPPEYAEDAEYIIDVTEEMGLTPENTILELLQALAEADNEPEE